MKRLLIAISIITLVTILYIASSSVQSTRLVSSLTVSEQINTASIDGKLIKHAKLDETVYFREDSASNTDVDHVYADEFTSSGTLDLSNLTNSLGESLDLTNERVMAIKLKNISTVGTDAISIDSAGTNNYSLFGAAYNIDLKPRQSVLYKADSMLVDVDASNCNIDYTLNNDTLSIVLISADLDN